jgi:hypothetical protein
MVSELVLQKLQGEEELKVVVVEAFEKIRERQSTKQTLLLHKIISKPILDPEKSNLKYEIE